MFYVTNLATTVSGLGNALSIFAVAFGIIGFAGGAVGYFSKGRADAIIKGQAELLDVRDRKISDQDSQLAAITAERDSLKTQIVTLTGLAQGSPQLTELIKQIKQLPKSTSEAIVRAMRGKK